MTPQPIPIKEFFEQADFLMSVQDVAAMVGVRPRTIYRWAEDPGFPRKIKFGRRCVRWSGIAIQTWIKKCAESRGYVIAEIA